MFSDRLLEHFRNPRHVGTLAAPAVTVRVENPVCGDILTLSAAAPEGVISEIRYKARGCTASIAAGSALAELLLGMRADQAAAVSADDVEAALDGLPNESKHAGRLASDAAKEVAALLAAGPDEGA